MGTGCTACKRNNINSPVTTGNSEAKWKSVAPPKKAPGLFEDPKDFFRGNDPKGQGSGKGQKKLVGEWKSENLTKMEPRQDDEKSSNESWVGVPRRDNSSESFGKGNDYSGGVLIEFKPKASLPPGELNGKFKRSLDTLGETDAARNLVLKRLLTPCFEANDTVSFGDKNRKEPDDYIKQFSPGSETYTGNSAKEDSAKGTPQKPLLFHMQDSVTSVEKNSPAPEIHQGKVGQPAGTDDSMTIQRGSSGAPTESVLRAAAENSGLSKKDLEASIDSSKGSIIEKADAFGTEQENAEKEEEKKPEPARIQRKTENALPTRGPRIVKAIEQDKYMNYRSAVCKNVLKDRSPLISFPEQKEANTKGNAHYPYTFVATVEAGLSSFSVISPINDVNVCNSSLACGWGTFSF